MSRRLWLFQLPVVAVFTFLFWTTEKGVQGELDSAFLRSRLYPYLERTVGLLTDFKFRTRGPRSPENKVVVVEVDSLSIETLGRWPWHRDATAFMIERIFQAGAKVVGLDMVFSEPDQRVPDELRAVLRSRNLGALLPQYETDQALTEAVKKYGDRLVLGWASENWCQPRYEGTDDCPVSDPESLATQPKDFPKFAFSEFIAPATFDQESTALTSIVTVLTNAPAFGAPARHAGFMNVHADDDAFIRKTNLFVMAGGRPYPSLALEMARVGQGEDLRLSLNDNGKVKSVEFARSGKSIPVTPLGAMHVNFRGPSGTFRYVSAVDVMHDDEVLTDPVNRKLAGISKESVFKDAYVLVGLSAIGVYDMRSFPFESAIPGVDGHANILDNLLSLNPLIPGSNSWGTGFVLALMILGAIAFAYAADRLSAVPALVLFLVVMSGFGVADLKILFARDQNWNTAFLYMEYVAIFSLTIAAKYVLEERKKRFLRSAFAKYVAPMVVDTILKDPEKLRLGGEKKDLSILFIDIRGFTTFSEAMDAKQLTAFLNDYLGIMTEIVFTHKGTLDKYIGDALMAFWGAPLDHAEHAANACRAAVAMTAALREHHERFRTEYGIDVRIGVGVNTGIVNVGNMGSERSFEYTVVGDHVNLASRLEGLTKEYGVQILSTRFSLDSIVASGQPLPAHRVLDRVKVKGKKVAVELIELRAEALPAEVERQFQEGRTLYGAQRWAEARTQFHAVIAALGADSASETFVQRCVDFEKSPPASDWDGSWEMNSK
jgi:adenylate cyclase